MTIILSADSDWAIGRDGGLLAHIPEDMKFFRETTANSTVVMGRKTWESIGAKPLPGRVNCVISRSVKQLDGAQVFGSVEEFLGFAEKAEGKVFVIGGGEIYRQALPSAEVVWLTKIDADFEGDTTFPELPESEWTTEVLEMLEPTESRSFEVTFCRCERRA